MCIKQTLAKTNNLHHLHSLFVLKYQSMVDYKEEIVQITMN